MLGPSGSICIVWQVLGTKKSAMVVRISSLSTRVSFFVRASFFLTFIPYLLMCYKFCSFPEQKRGRDLSLSYDEVEGKSCLCALILRRHDKERQLLLQKRGGGVLQCRACVLWREFSHAYILGRAQTRLLRHAHTSHCHCSPHLPFPADRVRIQSQAWWLRIDLCLKALYLSRADLVTWGIVRL